MRKYTSIVEKGDWVNAGNGPLRVRLVPVHSHGECILCHMDEDLDDGMCKFCLWMTNDDEANPALNKKRGRDPLTFTGR